MPVTSQPWALGALADHGDDPEPDVVPPAQDPARPGKCNRKGIVLDQHVWTPDRRKCTRCGYTKPETAEASA